LNIKFQTIYLPNQNIAIDESLTLWKGCLSIRQYLLLKASKFGIKTFELRESRTGYLWCFLVYTGKNTILQSSLFTPDTPKTAAVVLELLEPLFGRGHTLFIDIFSKSPELASKLKIEHSTDYVGTLKLNRKNVPKEMKDKKLEKGEIIARHSGSVTVLKWHDKRNVNMVSTYHSADTWRVSNKSKETEKPLHMIDYNHNVRGCRFEGPIVAHEHDREEKNDQMVPQTFQKPTELYSSQFICCLSTNDGKKYTAALI